MKRLAVAAAVGATLLAGSTAQALRLPAVVGVEALQLPPIGAVQA